MSFDFPTSPTLGQLYPTSVTAGAAQYTWNGSAWIAVGSSENYVKKSGDTMTGALIVNAKVQGNPLVAATNATDGALYFGSGLGKSITTNGANFQFNGNVYATGAGIGYFGGSVYAGYANAASGIFAFGNSGAKFLQCDGVNYSFSAGALSINGILYTYDPNAVICLSTAGTVNCLACSPSNWGYMYLQSLLNGPGNWAGWQMAIGGNIFNFRHDGVAAKSAGSTLWVVGSDERIKTVKGDYTSGLEAVAALNPVRYVYKGNDTTEPPAKEALPYKNSTQHGPAVDQTEYIGLVAQQAEISMPELISKSGGYIDGNIVDDMRSADYTALIFALINAVKELKTRIEQLESAG